MTLADVYNMLDGITELKGKVRYRAFPIDSGDVPLPPYAVYFETDSNNFVADNVFLCQKQFVFQVFPFDLLLNVFILWDGYFIF